MTDKTKIKLIYVGVAVISLMILGMSFFLATLRKEKREEQAGAAALDVGKEQVSEITVLEKDIELQKEDGSTVKISDLKDKAWLAVQFYASCPMCAERNAETLLEVYREFKDDPDFRVICLSVDPEDDTPEKLAEMRELLEVDASNWWFLKTDRQPLWDFMRYEMLFADIRERTEPLEAAAKGKWSHDLGIQVYRGNTMVKKWHEGLEVDVLRDEVKKALAAIKEQP